MNLLFVNYGDFTSNSLNHLAGFAQVLSARGHACMIAVPQNKASISVLPRVDFIPATHDEVLLGRVTFPDGRPADLIHAWTPREVVRRFVVTYQRAQDTPARLVVHLEDHEEHLFALHSRLDPTELPTLDPAVLERRLTGALVHPLRYRTLLALAENVTVIVDRLAEFVPSGVPVTVLAPGVDFSLYRPQPADPALRHELGLREGERAIVFTGSNTFANEEEVRDLYRAVALLNEQGTPARLIRTGLHDRAFHASLPPGVLRHVLDLGFVEKTRLPALVALADVLVQPGRPGPFNDYRLPSKLPEYLASGRPVVLPATNIARSMEDGREALLLREGSPEEIAAQCARVLHDPALARRLGEAGAAFARRHFDLSAQTAVLEGVYAAARERPPNALWPHLRGSRASELALMPFVLSAPGSGAAAVTPEALTSLIRAEETRAERLAEAQARERETREHLAQQVKRLQRTRELTEQHAKNLDAALEAARRRLELTERRLRAADARDAERAADRAQLAGEVARLADKVRRMQATASWRLTTPLRALRRWLLDPLRRAPATATGTLAPPPAPAPAAPLPGHDAPPPAFRHTCNFDHPRSWRTSSQKLLLLGWCFEQGGHPISGIRARFRGEVVDGIYGSKRLDVLAAVGGLPQAEYCGFKLELRTTPGDHPLVLEVRHDERWVTLFESTVHVATPGDPAERSDYERWCEEHEALSAEDRQAIAEHISSFRIQPVFSVVMPVFNPPPDLLREAIESVRAQLYPHWELCIADDASTDPAVRPVLEAAAAADPRLKVVFRETNGHISAASNSALELATGDWIAFLDHDDRLHPSALYELAAEIDRHPEAELIYSDEDKIDGEGRRFDPYFKPDWNPDLFHGQNYLSHLTVIRATRIAEVGGFRLGLEGSQDWDLTLRVVEKLSASQIRHIPRVLYHWRAVPGSTALQLAEKAYPVEAARRALLDHFARVGETIELRPVPGDHWRVQRPVPVPAPLVSLLIPTRNGLPLLRRAVESILERSTYPHYEILVVDNGSDDPALTAWLEQVRGPRLRVVSQPGPFNFSALNNHAVREAAGEVVGLLNNDIEVISPDWLEELVSHACRPGIGAVGALLYYPTDTIQHAGVVLGLGGVAGHPFKDFPRHDQGQKNRLRLVQNYSAVTGACLFIRRELYLSIGGLDEDALPVAFNDVDLCCRLLAAGYRNVWTPFAELYHHESATRGLDDTPEKQARFQREIDVMMKRWPDLLAADPAYNPNLTLVSEDFSTAYFPRWKKSWLSLADPAR